MSVHKETTNADGKLSLHRIHITICFICNVLKSHIYLMHIVESPNGQGSVLYGNLRYVQV